MVLKRNNLLNYPLVVLKYCHSFYPTDSSVVQQVRGRGILSGREETRGVLSEEVVL